MIKTLLITLGLLPFVSPGISHAAPAEKQLEKTFKWAASGDANTLDPYANFEVPTLSFLENIYEPLVRRSKTMELEPALATKWTMVKPTLWRIELRKDVVFHDGSPFTADDVIFSLKRAKGPASDMANKLSVIKDAKKIDSHTIELNLIGPAPILPAEISQWFIMSEKWCVANKTEVSSNFRKKEESYATLHANGTGPFKVALRKPAEQTILELNAKWWDKKSDINFTKAIFSVIPTAQTRVAALLSSQVDVIFPIPLQDIDRIKASAAHDVIQGDELRTIYLGFNHWENEPKDCDVKGKNPFKDLRVRQAIAHAIDIEALTKKIMRGSATPAGLMYAPAVHGFDAKQNTRLPYDIEKAKSLLKEAGYENGFKVTFDAPNDRYVADEDIAKALASMLAKINITLALNVQPKAKFFPKVLSSDTAFYLFGWTPVTLDAYDTLTNIMQTPNGSTHGQFNLGKYSNPKFDELCDKIQVETDAAKRDRMIVEASQIHKDDMGHIPLHQQKLAWAKTKKVSLVQRPDDYFCLRWVKLSD